MQEIVIGLRRDRHRFFLHRCLHRHPGNTERCLQATTYSRTSGTGFRLRTLGRIITLHVVLGIAEQEHGGLKAMYMGGGSLLVLLHSYGFMENVSISHHRFPPKLVLLTYFTAGAGKSVIWYDGLLIIRVHKLMLISSSTDIEDIRALQKSGLASLAFFYCDFREGQKKDIHELLSSLLVQLGGQSDIYSVTLFNFYAAHDRGSQHPSDDELLECLKDMLKCSGQVTVYIVIDGLDECPTTTGIPSPHENVFGLVEDLVCLQIPNLQICVTSRPEADISDVFQPLTSRSISLHEENGQVRDIAEYVKSVIKEDRKLQRWNAKFKQLVIDVLTSKADGM